MFYSISIYFSINLKVRKSKTSKWAITPNFENIANQITFLSILNKNVTFLFKL